MPWAKVRKTQAQIRQINREKSARHYASVWRHRGEILAKKKAARHLAAKEAEASWYEERRLRRVQHGEGSEVNTGRDGEADGPNWGTGNMYTRILQSLNRCTKGSASRYLQCLYDSHLDQVLSVDQSSPTQATQTSLTTAETDINALLSSCYRLENEVLQDGVTAEYVKLHQLSKRIKCILDCIVNLQMVVMDPDEDLEKAYKGKRLDFQKELVQRWMDGAVDVPE